jgi:FkbM family methyltransferase
MKETIVKLLRKLTEPFLFHKRLPGQFGNHRILVTSRSDIRLLAPGLEQAAGDLFHVVGKYVSEGDTVWDIGSNLGILTFCSGVKVGPKGHVYSLEADPRYADIQSRTLRNFTENSGKISILCAAVADRSGVLDLVIPKKGHARNHLGVVAGNSAGEAEMTKQVVTLTLDWLLDFWSAPDFIKVDVEGAEVLVTRGAEKLFSEIRPVCYIECSPENSEAMTRFFKERDYLFFSLDDAGGEHPIDRFQFNTVAKPRERCSNTSSGMAGRP